MDEISRETQQRYHERVAEELRNPPGRVIDTGAVHVKLDRLSDQMQLRLAAMQVEQLRSDIAILIDNLVIAERRAYATADLEDPE